MPIDLSTLAILAGLFFGSVVGDAVLFGSVVQVHITVPKKLEDQGFTEETAEQLFVAEVARVGQAPSIVPTPEADLHSRPSVLESLVKPLGLTSLVDSLQYQLGFDTMTIHGALIDDAAGPGLQMVIVVSQPNESPAKIRLAQADGNAAALVEQASRLALQTVSPYRVALTDFWEGRHGDTAELARAKDVALAAVNAPWDPSRSTERVMLRNLIALLALHDGSFADAEAQFKRADLIPDALPAARGTVALNRAFVAIAQRRADEAVSYYKDGMRLSAGVPLPGYAVDLTILGGLVAWSAGDTKQAEELLRRAVAVVPRAEAGHFYLAQLLKAKGDAAGAHAELEAAAASQGYHPEVPALAQSDFWVDPVNGGLTARD